MVDLVGTCPKGFWEEWIAEGDADGDPETGEEWGWFTEHSFSSGVCRRRRLVHGPSKYVSS